MENRELKKLMTRVAKGEISMEDAQELIDQEKTSQNGPKQEKSVEKKKDNTRKRKLNKTGGK